MPVTVYCHHCGKALAKSPSRITKNVRGKFYCCLACRHTSEAAERVTVKCEQCGKEFQRDKAHADRQVRQFCSLKCLGAWKGERQRGENHWKWNGGLAVKCDQCGKDFRQRSSTRLNRNLHNFCSSTCTTVWRVENGVLAGENNPAWKPPVRKPCDNCGKMIERQPNRVGTVERTHHFCNTKCHSQWKSTHKAGANARTWKGGEIDYYGPNWNRQSRAARKRDGYKCRSCGVSQKKTRRALDVHHIVPFRSFGYIPEKNDHYLQANHLDNLMSLCDGCHKGAECGRIPIQPTLLSA